MKYTLSVDIEPVPASRPRVTRWGTYNLPKYAIFKNVLASQIALALGSLGRLQGPFKLYAEFHRKSKRKADIDNFIKALMDSIQDSGIIENDADIKHVEVKMVQVKKHPMIYFELERMKKSSKKKAGRHLDGRTWDEMPEGVN